ncbi:hypothetical protein [Fodinicola feengrottensis]|uniref:Asp23/Gls24 family envelope stress response protein n=1 Tax=Fodinicola feengrottensis TaxID=435914 RepID=A0ABN2J1E2_9ACTN|nr:hypothetical protein [Fodinicola feengrottensis]
MTARTDLTDHLLAALASLPGLRPATPPVNASFGRWSLETLAIDVDEKSVRIRLVATALPLPPLLAHATAVLEPVLAASSYAQAQLRLIVTDLDAAALAR